jgi:hypothetical protein
MRSYELFFFGTKKASNLDIIIPNKKLSKIDKIIFSPHFSSLLINCMMYTAMLRIRCSISQNDNCKLLILL